MSDHAVVDRTNWMSRGACLHADPELFFPAAPGTGAPGRAEGAKAVCACCRVRADCLGYALSTRQNYGVWGGVTEDERWAMIRRSRRTSARRPG